MPPPINTPADSVVRGASPDGAAPPIDGKSLVPMLMGGNLPVRTYSLQVRRRRLPGTRCRAPARFGAQRSVLRSGASGRGDS